MMGTIRQVLMGPLGTLCLSLKSLRVYQMGGEVFDDLDSQLVVLTDEQLEYAMIRVDDFR